MKKIIKVLGISVHPISHKHEGARTREEMTQYPFMSMPTSDV